jgi:hypothetical protein
VWLLAGRTDLCPVTALEIWLKAAEISDGPLFRRLWRLPPPRLRNGARRKADSRPLSDWDQPDRHEFDRARRQEMDRARRRDGAAFAGHSLRRGAISSGVAQGVHIPRLKQFSGHASLKSLEDYVELDELRQHPP